MIQIETLLNRYAKVAREEIRKDFKIDSCIASTRITLEVFKRLGIKGQPVPVQTTVVNVNHWIDVGFHDPKSVGHVIALLNKLWLVDAAIDQCTRPEKELFLPPVFYSKAPKLFLKGEPLLNVIDNNGRIGIQYTPHTNKLLFQSSKDWLLASRWAPVVRRILARI